MVGTYLEKKGGRRTERGLGHAACGVVEDDVQEGEHPDVPRGEDALDLGKGVGLAVGAAFELHALSADALLVLGEVPCFGRLGHVGEKEEGGGGDGERDDAVDDEKPLPSTETVPAFEAVHGGHEIARDHVADVTGSVEDAGALGELVFAVPGSDHVLDTGIASAFEEADEEAQDVELGGRGCSGEEEGQDGPGNLDWVHVSARGRREDAEAGRYHTSQAGSQYDGRMRVRMRLLSSSNSSRVSETVVTTRRLNAPRDLAHDVSHGKGELHVVQLQPIQAQVFAHSRDEGVVNVDLVEILEEEGQGPDGKDGCVELQQEALLLWRLVQAVPEVGAPCALRLLLNERDNVGGLLPDGDVAALLSILTPAL